MADRARKVKFKPRRFVGAVAVILLVTFGADTVWRSLSNDEHHNLVIDGDFCRIPDYARNSSTRKCCYSC